MRHGRWVIALTALLALCLSSTPARAGAPKFWVRCTVTRESANIDPIVAFGGVSAHAHVFFGTSVRRTDNSETLRDRARSNCSAPGDFSGYWVPTVHNAKGKLVTPDDVLVYYRQFRPEPVVPFPRMLGAVSTDVRYSCGRGTPAMSDFGYCQKGSPRIIVNLAPLPEQPNFPEVRIDVRWTSYRNATGWTTSSDAQGPRHGDFLNGWKRKPLQYLIDRCLEHAKACGKVDAKDFKSVDFRQGYGGPA